MIINGDITSPHFIDCFDGKKFNHIVVDPPWRYNARNNRKTKFGLGTNYDSLSLEQLSKIPIFDLADERCHLYLWATMPRLNIAIDLIKAWGFKYSTVMFCWVKVKKRALSPPPIYGDNETLIDIIANSTFFGTGFYSASNVELVLLGIKGKPFKHIKSKKSSQVIYGYNKLHSRKPEKVLENIDYMYPMGNRIELFARECHNAHWWTFGNELKDICDVDLLEHTS